MTILQETDKCMLEWRGENIETIFSPMSDLIFKRIFSDTNHIKKLLHELLEIPLHLLDDLEVQDPFLLSEELNSKIGILDLNVTLKSGQRINIEVQKQYVKGMNERILHYGSKLVATQLASGDAYTELRNVIILLIVAYNFFKESLTYFHKNILQTEFTHHLFTDKLAFYVLEAGKAPLFSDNTAQYKWSALFMAKTLTDLKNIERIDETMTTLTNKVKELNADAKARAIAEKTEQLRVGYLIQEAAERKAAREEGIEQGIEQGIRKIAINMKKANFSTKQILDTLAISKEDLDSF